MYRSKIAFYYYFTNLSLNVISKIVNFIRYQRLVLF